MCAAPELAAQSGKRVVVFDLELGGHHASYIQYLIEYWCENELDGQLLVVVAPEFTQMHARVVALTSRCKRENVQFVPVDDDAFTKTRQKSWLRTVSGEWKLLVKCCRQLEATHCLVMHYDRYQLPLALDRAFPCPISGIYFRPTFHYSRFSNHEFSLSDGLRAWRHKLLLRRNLGGASLRYLFCLDPYVIGHIEGLRTANSAVYLPDPVKTYEDDECLGRALRDSLALSRNRKVFLLFGSLARRKGIFQLLDALFLLPRTAVESLCLMLVGQIRVAETDALEARIAEARESLPLSIFRQHEFLPERSIQSYFHAADVVLAPYQRHTGMSGIMVRAAAAGKPILAPTYGLVGELVCRRALGLTVDTTKPTEIARGLEVLIGFPANRLFDRDSALQFAREHMPDQFARTLLDRL